MNAEPPEAVGSAQSRDDPIELHLYTVLMPEIARRRRTWEGARLHMGYDNDYRLTSEAVAGDPGGVNGTVSYTLYDAANNRKDDDVHVERDSGRDVLLRCK